VLAGSRVHILGAFENIGMARERYVFFLPNPALQTRLTLRSIVSLVLGAQPGKVYNSLRIIAGRMKERF
jgi:RNA-binding protein PNO1